MRLREKDLTTVYLKKRAVVRDEEGEKTEVYSLEGVPLRMNVQSAGGSVAAQIYGDRLPYIKSCKYQGSLLNPLKNEKDGICLGVPPDEKPDYFIRSIQPYSTHLNVTLERL